MTRLREGMALLVAGLALSAPAAAQSRTDVLLHATGLSYQDSQVKDAGWVAGFYGTYGSGWKHLVEVGATRTGVDHLDGWQLRQTDVAAAYGYYGAQGAARAGLHVISGNDVLSDGGMVLFGGASRYRVGSWSAGAEGALSSYGDYDGGLTVVQVAPSVALTKAAGEGRHVLGASLRGYYIKLSEDLGLGSRDFLSGEAALSYTSGRLSLSGFAWSGEQAFAVRGGGFTVFNLAELHTGGFGGGLRWVLSPRSALSAGYYMERFEDMGLANKAWTRSLSASLGYTL
ncbi:MAG TPA: hypothetical protein VLH75_10590 [Longimicrobiales bacterium]|nr:hypothetical protein [Longimicrobiales bacterium]